MHTTGISQRGQDGALAEVLLERGADPNDAEAGYSALHAAVLREQEALVGVPLAYGGRSELHGQDRHERLRSGSSVIVENVDVRRPGRGPAKDDAPLVVDPNAVQPGHSALQRFESVPGR